jgi:hypothetical protein
MLEGIDVPYQTYDPTSEHRECPVLFSSPATTTFGSKTYTYVTYVTKGDGGQAQLISYSVQLLQK